MHEHDKLHKQLLSRNRLHPPVSPPKPEPECFGDLCSAKLSAESKENIDRAPAGTRFYCVATEEGETHCAASLGPVPLDESEKSYLGGDIVEPITVGYQGTGHQQIARRMGMMFDEETARVGYVDGEGYGLSVEKISDCERAYTYNSAFNCKATPSGSRAMPEEMAQIFYEGIEAAFDNDGCPCAQNSEWGSNT